MYREAKEDGIRIVDGKYRELYSIPCEMCGTHILKTQYSRKRNYVCSYCKNTIKKKEKLAFEQITGTETTAERRFKKAVANIEKQVRDFDKYENAIRIAKTRIEKYGSIPEAMVAIELLKNKYRIIPQQKIGKYRVDFALPDIKRVIEVDGALYHKNINKGDREATIQLSLGASWKTLHIPAELIAKDIRKLRKIIETIN